MRTKGQKDKSFIIHCGCNVSVALYVAYRHAANIKAYTRASYGKGPDYFLLKTLSFPISASLCPFSMTFGTELENDYFDSLVAN